MDIGSILASTAAAGAQWSVRIRDVTTGESLCSTEGDRLLRTASVGKLFLLVELAAQLEDGRLSGSELVRRDAVEPVADSGLWQHLSAAELSVGDAAYLVGAVSDNWATNALLELVGLDTVRTRAGALAPGGSTLHDRVRDHRGPEHPATLSEGCADDLAGLLADLAAGSVVSPAVSRRVLDWLAPGTDLSMVAAGFGLDPLAHVEPDRGIWLRHKTGTSAGVRADVGVVTVAARSLVYAVLVNWDPTVSGLRDPVLTVMRQIGETLR